MDRFSDSQSKEEPYATINVDDVRNDDVNTERTNVSVIGEDVVQDRHNSHETECVNRDNRGVYSNAIDCDLDENKRNRQPSYMSVGGANNNESQVQDLIKKTINSEILEDERRISKVRDNGLVHYDNNNYLTPAPDNKNLTKVPKVLGNKDTYMKPINNKKNIYMSPEPGDNTFRPPLPNRLKRGELNNELVELYAEIQSIQSRRSSVSDSSYTDGRISSETRQCSKWRILTFVSVTAVLLAVVVFIMLGVLIGDEYNKANCKTYRSPVNGHVDYTDPMNTGSSVHISCELGFRTDGADSASCLSNGTWDRIVTCELVDCGPYQPPEHTYIVGDVIETTFNSTIYVACDIGFNFGKERNDSVRCNENGYWSGDPYCESEVVLSASPELFVIGKAGNLTCIIGNIPGWTKIEFSRINNNDVSFGILTIVEQSVGTYDTTIIGGDNVKVVESELTPHGATVVVMLDVVQCSDAFGNAGDVVYACNVFIDTSITVQAKTSIRIQHEPTIPTLTVSQQVVESYATWTGRAFICEMNFPEPNGYITIESDYDGGFTSLLSSVLGRNENELAFIDSIRLSQDNCWHRTVVVFGLKNVTMQWHRKHIRCIAASSDTSVGKTTLVSDYGVVKVIPEHFCKGQAKEVLLHPYNCSLFVLCDKNDNYTTVSGVPAACKENFCFDTYFYACPACSVVGGCSLTDIYFDNSNTLTVGDAATLVCLVEDFDGLADITITRDNGEQVSSTLFGDNVDGFNTIEDKSYLNVSSGVLSLSVDRLQCSDESTYRCVPTGKGQASDDRTSLQLGC